jgi:hypothetical protein
MNTLLVLYSELPWHPVLWAKDGSGRGWYLKVTKHFALNYFRARADNRVQVEATIFGGLRSQGTRLVLFRCKIKCFAVRISIKTPTKGTVEFNAGNFYPFDDRTGIKLSYCSTKGATA